MPEMNQLRKNRLSSVKRLDAMTHALVAAGANINIVVAKTNNERIVQWKNGKFHARFSILKTV